MTSFSPPDHLRSRPRRFAVLPAEGTLLVSGDLHGNGGDWRALVRRFEEERMRSPRQETHWVLLGDAVHGPDEEARRREPELYDYPDESWPIVDELSQLQRQFPGLIHYVLGNHDFSHVGGPRTAKFHADEAAHLESMLRVEERERLRSFFSRALLAAVAPCGVLLTHGSPDAGWTSLDALDWIGLPPEREEHWRLLHSLLTSYGQPREVTERLLEVVRGSVPGVRMVVHGHDRDPAGFFTEGGNQLCLVLFGAPRAQKRYLRLDLGARYAGVEDLHEGVEILRLHGEG
ncbi:MAG TPA: metallophosphoesterase [Myxococcales bacterium]|jgi:hypothetical protein